MCAIIRQSTVTFFPPKGGMGWTFGGKNGGHAKFRLSKSPWIIRYSSYALSHNRKPFHDCATCIRFYLLALFLTLLSRFFLFCPNYRNYLFQMQISMFIWLALIYKYYWPSQIYAAAFTTTNIKELWPPRPLTTKLLHLDRIMLPLQTPRSPCGISVLGIS